MSRRSRRIPYLLAQGNEKLGGRVWSFSLPPGETCPGATPACWGKGTCYALSFYRMRGNLRALYRRNFEVQLEEIATMIVPAGTVIRLHVSGDFHNAPYIMAWREFAHRNPDAHVYAYTRSWRVSALLPTLEALRARPNVSLFASIDEDTGLPPTGWRWAMMGDLHGHAAPGSIICPEAAGKVATCSACGLCWKHPRNLTFPIH